MEKEKVSIIVPIYNAEKYLRECLNSIINQTYKNLEIILIDDGSTDNCGTIIKEYEKKDSRIITLFQSNFGAPSARNKGIEIATGTYIMFFDSDDELFENSIENFVNNIQDADIVIGNFIEIDEIGNTIKDNNNFKNNTFTKKDLKKVLLFNTIPGNKMFKSNIIKENNIFFDNVRIEQDTNFYIKYICMSNKYITTSANIFKYRHTKNSISRTYGLNLLDAIISIDKAISFLELKNNKLPEELIILLKISDYFNKIKRAKYFEKKYRKIILRTFSDDLKKINIKRYPKYLRKKYYRLLLICKMCKYKVGIELVNYVVKYI